MPSKPDPATAKPAGEAAGDEAVGGVGDLPPNSRVSPNSDVTVGQASDAGKPTPTTSKTDIDEGTSGGDVSSSQRKKVPVESDGSVAGSSGVARASQFSATGDNASSGDTSGRVTSSESKRLNLLINERSPYLLQHAYNPVDWHPWGDEAFNKALAANKPIFLSIGYSTCHWCHVMERESFESEEMAQILNEHYICIKVDREERPDIDKIYMAYVQRTTGSGGWPLSLFLTPTLEPLFGGTYYPLEDFMGKVGFKSLAELIAKQWRDKHVVLNKEAKGAINMLKDAVAQRLSKSAKFPGKECWQKCYQQASGTYEVDFGGFSEAPKFPQPIVFNYLFSMYYKYPNNIQGSESLDMCLYTMKKMALGGIHDHVGSGFSRYSVDKKWHVPHFEKMLYDQAQIVCSYVDAYVVSKDRFYADVVDDVLKYVGRDLSHIEGGFYGAEDADSYPTTDSKTKKEGAFYTWTYGELQENITDPNDFDIFSFYMNVKENGNVNPHLDFHNELENQNILTCFTTHQETADKFHTTVPEVKKTLQKCLDILYEARKSRPRPQLDTKILTGWNGLMISGYAKAGFALNNSAYTDRAVKAANFVKKYLCTEEGTLMRCCYGDNEKIVHSRHIIGGFVDDYAFMIRGLIDLYEATLDCDWLVWAEELQNKQNDLFWDEKFNAYFVSAVGDRNVIYRDKEDQEGAEPAGNSVAVQNLIRLSSYLDRQSFYDLATKTLSAYADRLKVIPFALPEMTSSLLLYNFTSTQIFIAGERDDPNTQDLLDVVRMSLIPGRMVAIADGPEGKSSLFYNRHKTVQHLKPINGKAAAYVCKNFSCSLPVTDPKELEKTLRYKGTKFKSVNNGSGSSDSDSD